MIVGPSITGTKGGMATVINDMLALNNRSDFEFEHLVSHSEVGAAGKIRMTVSTFLRILSRRNYDLIHMHVASDASFYRKSLFVWAAKMRRKPVVIHVHGADFDTFYNKSSPFMKEFISRTFAACNKVLVLSSYWKHFFDTHIHKGNTEVLHNGVYVSVFKDCQTVPYNISNFLYLGRLGQRKGVYDLLKAIDNLVNNEELKYLQFYLAGDGDIEQVKQIVQQKGLAGNVQLLGWINEAQKLEWLKRADTMLLPSYNEGLPMAILESMAAGKIIISSKVGGIPDVVKENENGFLIEPGDVERLTYYIRYVSQHPEEMTNIAANNKRTIEADYNLEKINRRLLQIYEEILQ